MGDLIIIIPGGVLRGFDQLRPLFEKFVTEIAPPGEYEFEMLQQAIATATTTNSFHFLFACTCLFQAELVHIRQQFCLNLPRNRFKLFWIDVCLANSFIRVRLETRIEIVS